MMILVDTNVFSELVKPAPDDKVVEWLFAHRAETLLSTLVVAELDSGVRTTRDRAKRDMLAGWLDRLIAAHAERIVDFDLRAARQWGQFQSKALIADMRRGTRAIDTLLAAQALALNVPFATRNVADFADTGVGIINPWQA
jgi:predicted nucleic acid-binding protein